MADSTEWQQIEDDFFANGQFEKAIDAFQQAPNYNPNSLSSGIKIGLLLYKIGKEEEGAQYLAQYQVAGLGQRLLQLAQTKVIGWPGLSDFVGKIPDKKTANIFFLAVILDYQRPAE